MFDDIPKPKNFQDEMLVLDENGEFKILKDGQLLPWQEPDNGPKAASDQMLATAKNQPRLQPPTPVIYKPAANFYFDPEDEEEVSKIKVPSSGPQKKYSLEKIVLKILEKNNLKALSGDSQNRLKNIVFNFLRERRSLVDTTETLTKASLEGGLAFDQPFTEKLMAFLNEIKAKIAEEKGIVVEESKIPELPKVKPVLPKVEAVPAPLPPVQPVVPKPIKPLEPPKPVELPKNEPYRPPIKTLPKISALPQRSVKEGKVPMSDIRKDFKLVGPVDELGGITLVNFRRLGSSAGERAAKILERIERLSRESVSKKALGIQAWRKSPLYKMYLMIGQASMEHGVSAKDVIDRYLNQGQEMLTLEEFEIISDLNKKLRF